FLAAYDLLGVTDPVQLSIRLLIPRRSLMLELDEVAGAVGEYDEDLLSYRWESADPRADELQRRMAEVAEAAADCGADGVQTLVDMWRLAVETAGGDSTGIAVPTD